MWIVLGRTTLTSTLVEHSWEGTRSSGNTMIECLRGETLCDEIPDLRELRL